MMHRSLIWPIRLLVPLAMTLLVACGGGGSSSPEPTPKAKLVAITVTPGAPSFAKGLQQQLTATGSYSDGTTKDLTASASWNSSTASVASVSKGKVSALATGSSTISASAVRFCYRCDHQRQHRSYHHGRDPGFNRSDPGQSFRCPRLAPAVRGDGDLHGPHYAGYFCDRDLDFIGRNGCFGQRWTSHDHQARIGQCFGFIEFSKWFDDSDRGSRGAGFGCSNSSQCLGSKRQQAAIHCHRHLYR